VTTIVVRDVTRVFDEFTAVDRVSVEVRSGEIVGLLGANGAGKTTLIKMILGLLAPSAGEIRLFGELPTRQQRRRIGYVPQNLGLYLDLTAAANLEFHAEVFGVARVPTAGTDQPFAHELIRTLSLGDQRRVAFTAATQHHPELLVLDEPTSGVSPLSRSDLWDRIHEYAEAGAAVLVSTHHMDEADQADRLVVMARGHGVARGTPREVVADRWNDALEVLDTHSRRAALAGRSLRVLSGSIDDVRRDLAADHIAAELRLVPAALDEAMVALSL
jgi:ABC-2 type transport system ATP-binding protein